MNIVDGEILDDGSRFSLTNLLLQEEANKVIEVLYQPSESTLDLSESEDTDIRLGWHVELIDDKSFYILADFSHPALVSQKNNDLDRLQIKILNIEAFVNEDEKRASAPESTIVVSKVPTLIKTEFTQPETIATVKDSFAKTV